MTIRNDRNLQVIADAKGVPAKVAAKEILAEIISREWTSDSEEWCGGSVKEICCDALLGDVYDFLTTYTGKPCTGEVFNAFSELVFWGDEDDCEECGCGMELVDWCSIDISDDPFLEPRRKYYWKKYQCRNCGKIVTFNYE